MNFSAAVSFDRRESPFATGELLAGTYEIRGVVGEGGMGVVYDAHDRLLRRRVAIKAALDPQYAPALLNEARALASIKSPQFVEVFHVGAHRGVAYMVMERLYGETLFAHVFQTYRSGSRIAICEAIELLGAIASALSTAHEAGIAHRDLKSPNVILAPRGRVVLLDLGLSVPEVLAGEAFEADGSPEYVAPEVLRGEVERGEGVLVDLYALGVVAFEVLTGRTPFAADDLQRTLNAHLRAVPPDVRTLREDVPDALAVLVRRMLLKNPRSRPTSAQEIVFELRSMRTFVR
ncbi:MAG TPA: serine/threonine-protein kinase [Labilithrix sp.]